MSLSLLMNDNGEAQLSQNKLESIVNQTNVSTTPQINVGDGPTYVSYVGWIGTEDSVYVANVRSNTVSVINLATSTVKNIPVGDGPISIATVPLGYVYVANYNDSSVSVIDPLSNTVIKNIPVGDGPRAIATSSSLQYGDSVYVANYFNDSVSVIDPLSNTVIKNIPVGDGPISISTSSAGLFGGYVYVANSRSDTVSVIDEGNNTVIKDISVGDGPISIARKIDRILETDYVYVANYYDDSVSLIDPLSNTFIKNIPVGNRPISIATVRFGDYVYVANYHDSSVSVIDVSKLNTVIKNITVGERPIYVTYLGDDTRGTKDYVYVANYYNNSVSLIDPLSNTVIKNITVGDGPKFITTSFSEDSAYVANGFSNTLSIIDPTTNKVMAGVTFDLIPFRGGQIICNDLNAPINRYFYVSSGTDCIAKPRNGYEFDSWVQVFDDNSTRTINASTTSGSVWTPFLDFFGVKSNDPAANLTVNRFGNFTAYFKALPPPVPAEFTASLITVIITALVGSLLIPIVVSWLRSKKQTSRLNSFHQQMALIYSDDKVDENDIDQLNTLNKNISDSYAAGRINNDQYTNLKNEVSAAYQKIFKKRIESIADSNTETLNIIKNDIEDAYSDRKITELDYDLLNGKISRILDNK